MIPQTQAASALKDGNHALFAYVADLELEVDRLRKQAQFIEDEARVKIKRIYSLCTSKQPQSGPTVDPLTEIGVQARQLAEMFGDLHELPGYHPAHDQVIAIAIRPLIEQVFRSQSRMHNVANQMLRMDLQIEAVEWFPARLRHILENLVSNAVKYQDSNKGETRITLALRSVENFYELRVSDNGVGMSERDLANISDRLHRSDPVRISGFGVGLAVVKLLVEQSGGAFHIDSGLGQGTTVVVQLPRFDVDDFLD